MTIEIVNLLLLIVLSICLYTDLRFNKIYNLVIAPGILVALGYHLFTGGPGELMWSLGGMLLGMTLLIIPFAAGGMGAGDVKLMGFIGACGGPAFTWIAFLATALAGGVLAMLVLAKNRQLIPRLKLVWFTLLSMLGIFPRVNLQETIATLDKISIPYGVAITAGTVTACLVR